MIDNGQLSRILKLPQPGSANVMSMDFGNLSNAEHHWVGNRRRRPKLQAKVEGIEVQDEKTSEMLRTFMSKFGKQIRAKILIMQH